MIHCTNCGAAVAKLDNDLCADCAAPRQIDYRPGYLAGSAIRQQASPPVPRRNPFFTGVAVGILIEAAIVLGVIAVAVRL